MKNDDKVKLIVMIIELVIKYGWPMVTNFIETLKKENITLEDIQNLTIDDEEEFIPENND
jgi:hypothetical protein